MKKIDIFFKKKYKENWIKGNDWDQWWKGSFIFGKIVCDAWELCLIDWFLFVFFNGFYKENQIRKIKIIKYILNIN